MPPLNAEERTTLESWPGFHRTALARKYEALAGPQLVATQQGRRRAAWQRDCAGDWTNYVAEMSRGQGTRHGTPA